MFVSYSVLLYVWVDVPQSNHFVPDFPPGNPHWKQFIGSVNTTYIQVWVFLGNWGISLMIWPWSQSSFSDCHTCVVVNKQLPKWAAGIDFRMFGLITTACILFFKKIKWWTLLTYSSQRNSPQLMLFPPQASILMVHTTIVFNLQNCSILCSWKAVFWMLW